MRHRTTARFVHTGFGLALSVFALGAWPGGLRAEPPAPKQKPDVSLCAKVSASAHYQGLGYTHVVTLQNTCDKPVWCEVWTDVDPSPRHVLRASPGRSDEVATRKGSPAREVRADARCRIE